MKKTLLYITVLALFLSLLQCSPNSQRNSENDNATAEELAFSTGLEFNEAAYEKVPMRATLTRTLYASLPSSASLKSYCPEATSQGQYGTCVGWASSNARTVLFAKNKGMSQSQITDQRFSPGFIYHLIKLSPNGCSNGTYIESAVELLKDKGVVKYSDLSDKCVTNVDPLLMSKALKYKIDNYTRLFTFASSSNEKLEIIKKSLSEGNPVVFGMKVPESFSSAYDVWEPSESSSGNYGGHAMCLIGYDDNKHGGAFEILNSWGTDWGNDGFMWIKYSDFTDFTHSAFELIDNIQVNPETETADLSGKLEFFLSSGSKMSVSKNADRGLSVVEEVTSQNNNYKMQESYSSGTRFRLYISNNQPAYVYAISSDKSMNVNKLFPHKSNISPALNYSENQVAIPDEKHYIQMDTTSGTDIFCLLYSKIELDIDQVISDMTNSSGTFNQRLKNILGSDLVHLEDIDFDQNEIKFSAKSQDKSIVPVIVEIVHN